MKVQELGIEEMARHGATHRVVITAADINGTGTGYGALSASAAASTSGTLNPFAQVAAGVLAQFVDGFLKAAFVPNAATALTCAIGYDLASGTDKPQGFLAPTSILNGVSPVSYFPQEIADVDSSAVDGTYGTQESAAITTAIAAINSAIKSLRKVFGVANTVQVTFASTTANLTDLVGAGELHLYFRLLDLNKV